jgi:hypothetical protein
LRREIRGKIPDSRLDCEFKGLQETNLRFEVKIRVQEFKAMVLHLYEKTHFVCLWCGICEEFGHDVHILIHFSVLG